MFKFGITLLFSTFVHLTLVIISYEFFFKFAVTHGGIGVTNSMDAVNPLIWIILVIELAMSIYLIWKLKD